MLIGTDDPTQNNDSECVVREVSGSFTVAQIMEFTRLTTGNNCPNCAAMLLEYKQERYPGFDLMAEFTLDE